MEKRDLMFVVLFICLILIAGFVFAQNGDISIVDDSNVGGEVDERVDDSIPAEPDPSEDDLGITPPDVEGLKEDVKEVSETEIVIPESMQVFARGLFGIKKGTINLDYFIILICVWVMLFVIIWLVIGWVFEGRIIGFIAAVLITAIASMSGFLSIVTEGLLAMVNGFGWFSDWPIINLVLAVIIAIILFAITYFILKKVGEYAELGEADEIGEVLPEIAKVAKELTEKASKEIKD